MHHQTNYHISQASAFHFSNHHHPHHLDPVTDIDVVAEFVDVDNDLTEVNFMSSGACRVVKGTRLPKNGPKQTLTRKMSMQK
jgi:hypothetical protein